MQKERNTPPPQKKKQISTLINYFEETELLLIWVSFFCGININIEE